MAQLPVPGNRRAAGKLNRLAPCVRPHLPQIDVKAVPSALHALEQAADHHSIPAQMLQHRVSTRPGRPVANVRTGPADAGSVPQALSASVVKLSPQPHSAVAFGLLNVKVSLRPCLPKSITVPSTSARLLAST